MVLGRGAGAAGDGEGEGDGDGACAVGDSGELGVKREDAGPSGEPHPTSATAPASTTSLVILIWRDYRHGYRSIGADPPRGWALRQQI